MTAPSTLIAVAPTGAASATAQVPTLPVTLDELVQTARDCAAVGAAVVHLQVRDAEGRPTVDPVRLRDTVQAVREATGLVVQLSPGSTGDELEAARLAVLEAEPDAVGCAMGAASLGADASGGGWDVAVELHTALRDREVFPVYEVSDLEHLTTLHRLLDEHGAPHGGHVHVGLVLGLPGGLPGTAQGLVAALDRLPAGASFSATGVGDTTLPVMLTALAAGGHLRVGTADTLTYAPRQPVTGNVQLVARAAGLARIAQRPPMTIDGARDLLGIHGRRLVRTS